MDSDSQRWQQLQELFHLAAAAPPHEREQVLADACPDPEIRQRVLSILSASEVEPDARPDPPQADAYRHLNGRIGAYRLVRHLGTGGLGSVYLAERMMGGAPHHFAVKMLAEHAVGPYFVERFHREEHILASLEHPNITRMLDAGLSETDQPYLVMEYVNGTHLDEHCDALNMEIQHRLELFLQVCDAVAYAHRNLVVHLDLKPSNILVTHEGIVKLLDFGTSKFIEPEAHLTTTIMATPAYASPEQLRNEPVTTACDIYSLGAILFEQLSGHRPGGQASAAVMIERAVREQEPERIVTAATEGSAQHRALTLTRIRSLLKGDLENIVAKCLRSRPKDRYLSVDSLADDVRRYLSGRPVMARAQTRTYRLTKFVRRNRRGVVATALACMLLLASLGYAEWRQQQALKEGRRAERETAAANAVKTFLDEDIIRAASPYRKTSPQDVTVRDAVDRGADKAVNRFKNQPEIAGEVHTTLGQLYAQLNQYPKAEAQFRAAIPLLQTTLGERDAKTRDAQYALASLLTRQSKYDEAHSLLQRLDALRQPADIQDPALSAARDDAWGHFYYRQHEWDKEEPFDLAEIADYQRWQPDDVTGLAMRRINLAILYVTSGRLDDANRVAHQVVRDLDARGYNTALGYATAMSVLGRIEYFRRDDAQAEPTSTKAYELLKTIEGEHSLRAVDALYILDRLQLDTGRYTEGLNNARQIHAVYVAVLGDHSDTAFDSLYFLGHNEFLAGLKDQGIRDMETGLTGTGGLDPKAKNILEKYFLAGDYLDYGSSKLEAARAIVTHQIDINSLRRVQPDADWSARLNALQGQIAYYDHDDARARQLLEPALTEMIARKSPRFEIDRAQRCLRKLNHTS